VSLSIELDAPLRAALAAALPELKAALVDTVRVALNDKLLTVSQAAEILGCSPMAVRKRVARGALQVVRLGRSIRVKQSSLLGESGQ